MYIDYFWEYIEQYFTAFQFKHQNRLVHDVLKRKQYNLDDVYISEKSIVVDTKSCFGTTYAYPYIDIDDFYYIEDMCIHLPYGDAEKCNLLRDLAKGYVENTFIFAE